METAKQKPKPLDPNGESLDVEGAASLLALRPSTIRKLVALRQVPYFKLGARLTFSRQELLAYRDRHRVAPIGERATRRREKAGAET